MIRRVMAEAGRTFADLGAVAVTVGPGSFTGVRIGRAAARGIALAAGCPCIGVTTLEGIALEAGAGTPLLVAMDTRRGEGYAQSCEGVGAARADREGGGWGRRGAEG